MLKHVFVDGIIGSYSDDENVIGGALSDPYDVGILIFLVILKFSKTAAEKIEAAGGKAEVI